MCLYYYLAPCEFSVPVFTNSYHRSLCDSKSILVLGSLLRILADFNSAVFSFDYSSTLQFIDFSLFLRMVPRALIFIYITVTHVSQLFSPVKRLMYLLSVSPSFAFNLYSVGTAKFYFLLLINTRFCLLVMIGWTICFIIVIILLSSFSHQF